VRKVGGEVISLAASLPVLADLANAARVTADGHAPI